MGITQRFTEKKEIHKDLTYLPFLGESLCNNFTIGNRKLVSIVYIVT